MQPNDLFSFPNLIDQVHEWASPWMANLLPWLGVMIGLAVVFVIARGIIDYFENKAENAFANDQVDLNYEKMESMNEDEMEDYLEGKERKITGRRQRMLNSNMYYDLHEQKMKKRNRGIIDTFLLK